MDKQKNHVPCIFQYWSETRKRFFDSVPAVDCSGDCVHCGWNPDEQERRLRTGVLCKHDKTLTLHFFRKETQDDRHSENS